MVTFIVGADTHEVEIVSLGNPDPPGYIPPAGIHPVVQMQGQPVSFFAPLAFAQGTRGSLSSGFDIPYAVRVNVCIPHENGFLISGTIGV